MTKRKTTVTFIRGCGLDSVRLSDNEATRQGLEDMLTAAIGDHAFHLGYVQVPLAVFVLEVARRAEDRPEWFPRGKWATIQSMDEETERELAWLFGPG